MGVKGSLIHLKVSDKMYKPTPGIASGWRKWWVICRQQLASLVIKAKAAFDREPVTEIKKAFQESELSFKVALFDWNDISPAFRKSIESNGYEPLP